jgi:hypothetical protein
MIILLVAIFMLIILSAALIIYADEGDTIMYSLSCAVGVIGVLVSVVSLIVYICLIYDYIGASYKAEIINTEYSTNYTQEEFFWASDVINTVRELNRTRIEINGSISQKDGKK